MPRPPSVWWSDAERCWLTSVGGEVSEATGRKKPRRNRAIGPPIGPDRIRNERMAHEWLESLLEAERRRETATTDPTFETLVERYLDWIETRLQARTRRSYEERLLTFRNFRHDGDIYGNRLVRDLRPADLVRFIRAHEAKGHVPNYINSILLSVNACLNWAVRPIEDRQPERILKENPFAGVKRPRGAAPPRRYAGSVARRAFLRYAHLRASATPVGTPARRFEKLAVCLWRLVEATGCRPSEACRLEWPMIDWDGARVEIKGKSSDVTGRYRIIPIPPRALRLLRAIERLPGRHPTFVFTHARRDGAGRSEADRRAGVPWTVNALDHKFRQWRDEAIAAGLPIEKDGPAALTLYAMRRDMGADILRRTGSHAESAEILGHSPAMNARHYATFENERAVKLATDVEAARMREAVERRRKARGDG
jgi:integrase